MLSIRNCTADDGGDARDSRRGELIGLFGEIHEASLAPERWPRALARIGAAVGGARALVELGHLRPPNVFIAEDSLAHPDHLDFFRRHDLVPGGTCALDRDLRSVPVGVPLPNEPPPRPPEPVRSRCPKLGEALRPRTVHAAVACILKNQDFAAFLHLGREAAAFGQDDLAPLRHLIPPLRHALQVHRRLSVLEAERHAAADALDRLQLGAIVVDAAGRALLLNRRAEEIVAARDGLAVSGGRLEAATPADTSALIKLIDQAASLGAGHGLFAGGARPLPRPSMRPPLAVLVAPLRREAAAFGGRCGFPAAVVFVTDPAREDETPERVLRAVYGLTRTEAALVLTLLRGNGLARAAERLRMTPNTAKTHLQHVFEKTGTHHQAELVRFILKGPARLRFD